MKSKAAYGSWSSQLTSEVLADKGRRYGHLALDQGNCYWLEVRASEKGRGVLMASFDGKAAVEVLPKEISVRSKVHEYGGGDFCVYDGVVYFSNAADNRVYQFKDQQLTAVTPETKSDVEDRYADFCFDAKLQRLYGVRERHTDGQVINDLVAIELTTKLGTLDVSVLQSGFDFYSFPRLAPTGDRLCWTCWDQPDMPWDAAELWLADIHMDGSLDAAHKVSGGDGVAIFQPDWSADGVLHYTSDASNWSNLYSHRDGVLNALAPIDRDFATPQWIFGLATYVINPDHSLYALEFEAGRQKLSHIDPQTGHIEPVELPFSHFNGPLLGDGDNLYFCAASPTQEASIYRYEIATKKLIPLVAASEFILDRDNISVAQAITFESKSDRPCHAFYYPPVNSETAAPKNTQPPLIVMSHGGPTAFSDDSLDPGVQFWTNRGFAVVDVNYGGSSGYGKKYRELLTGQWGVVDVEDCVAAAEYLVEKGLADTNALLIRGGSAGGYTTLCALTFTDAFAAGMSRYGVADLESLASDSHKFEARYLDKIVGPYPEAKALYQERSPIHHTDKLSCPILLLQGSDDKVVPPNQAELMVDALKTKGIPYAYLLFAGEGHGFRQAETIVKAFNAELSFYRQILKIESDEEIEVLAINYLEN